MLEEFSVAGGFITSYDFSCSYWPLYERQRKHDLHCGPEGFNREALDRIFSGDKWNYKLKEVPGGYEAMVELHFNPGVIDRGMGDGRLPEIAILRALGLALANGFTEGEKPKQ